MSDNWTENEMPKVIAYTEGIQDNFLAMLRIDAKYWVINQKLTDDQAKTIYDQMHELIVRTLSPALNYYELKEQYEQAKAEIAEIKEIREMLREVENELPNE